MDFSFTAEEEHFRQEVWQFLREEAPDGEGMEDYDMYDEDWEEAQKFRRKLGEKGWLGISWPRQYGGGGRSAVYGMIFQEEIYYHRAPGRDLQAVGISGPLILVAATDEQKRRFLPPIARGEVTWTLGYTEPGAGSDAASVKTLAVDHGDHFTVNGYKNFAGGGHRCDFGLFTVITNPDAPRYKGMSILAIDMKSPGVEPVARLDMIGHPSCVGITLKDVKVPKNNLIGEQDQGWLVLMKGLALERWLGLGYGAAAHRILDDLVDYVKGYHAFDGVLAKNLTIRQKLAQLEIDVETNRLLAYEVACLFDQGIISEWKAALLKLHGAELLQRAGRIGLEILGLYGQLDRNSKWAPLRAKIQRSYLWSSQRTIVAGTSEVERNVIATRGLRMPRS